MPKFTLFGFGRLFTALVSANPVKQNAAAEDLARVHRSERLRGGEIFGMHHQLRVARFEFLHAAIEDNPATVDEHEIG